MSLSIGNALVTVAMAWISTKAAPFGMMISRKEYSKLDRVFFRAMSQSIILALIGAVIIWAATFYIYSQRFILMTRILSPLPFGILLATMIVNVIVFSEAYYLRAHKQEKFLLGSVLSAIFTGFSTYFLGRKFGAIGMVSGYFAVGIIVGLGYCTYIFQKYRKLWHAN
jgi:O-antigen/teichoic acid export membrane protein